MAWQTSTVYYWRTRVEAAACAMFWWFLMLRETSEVWSLVGVVLLVYVSLIRLVSLMWVVGELNLVFGLE